MGSQTYLAGRGAEAMVRLERADLAGFWGELAVYPTFRPLKCHTQVLMIEPCFGKTFMA